MMQRVFDWHIDNENLKKIVFFLAVNGTTEAVPILLFYCNVYSVLL